MDPTPRPPAWEGQLLDWMPTVILGGALCLLFGLLAGWIIWRNARKLLDRVETGNRDALADYERASDEASRIKAKLTDEDE